MPLIAAERPALERSHPLELLGRALRDEGVACCHWKGHQKRERWATGSGDVDLLVARADAARFHELAARCGFKEAVPPAARAIAGLSDYLGNDAAAGVLLRVHVHYRLVVGRSYTARYRLPVEQPVLRAAAPASPFPIPSPEWAVLLLVLRTALDRRGASAGGNAFAERAAEAEALEAVADPDGVAAALAAHLPALPRRCFDACLAALVDADPRRWARAAAALRRELEAFREPAPAAALLAAAAARARALALRAVGAAGARRRGSKRLAGGGAVIALVGGDGAGKSTAAAALEVWLAPELLTLRVHAGRPPRSLATLAAGGALKLAERFAGARGSGVRAWAEPLAARVRMLRTLCTARDRLRLCRAATRFAARGGIVIAERYPIRHEASLAGPHIRALAAGRRPDALVRRMLRAEEERYRRIPPPDAVVLMRVTPEVAAARKTGEPADYVLARNLLVSRADWAGTGAQVVDADQPLDAVLRELREVVWRTL